MGAHRSIPVRLSLGVVDVAVLDAEHDVGAGAAAGGLLIQGAALQRRGHPRHRPVADSPRLAVAVKVPLTPAGGPVPHHLLRP